ncbi:MAG: dihydroxyacetone kinase subunit L [Caldilineaceae bacterium]|nr:dihydroxyacetone kinase subunit L [Caldilineaceae bacterium]
MSGSAQKIVRLSLQRMLAAIVEKEEELGRLDAAAGDGDHGSGMVRGLRAAVDAAENAGDQTPGELLTIAGSAFADAAGGASGALVGSFLQTIGQTLGEGPFDAKSVERALSDGMTMMMQLGKAKPGDKTMIDTLHPFAAALREAAERGEDLPTAWRSALIPAEAGARSTVEMMSKRGRSSRLRERSIGHLDPGAMSMLYMLRAVGEVLQDEMTGENR